MRDRDFQRLVLEDHLVVMEGLAGLFEDTEWAKKLQERVVIVKQELQE